MTSTRLVPARWTPPQQLSGPAVPPPPTYRRLATTPIQPRSAGPKEDALSLRRAQQPPRPLQLPSLPPIVSRTQATIYSPSNPLPRSRPMQHTPVTTPTGPNSSAPPAPYSNVPPYNSLLPLDHLTSRLKTLYDASLRALTSRVQTELAGYTHALSHAQREAETMRAYCVRLKGERDGARAKIAALSGVTFGARDGEADTNSEVRTPTSGGRGVKRTREDEAVPSTTLTVPSNAPPLQFRHILSYPSPPSPASIRPRSPTGNYAHQTSVPHSHVQPVLNYRRPSRSKPYPKGVPADTASGVPLPSLCPSASQKNQAILHRSLSPLPLPISSQFNSFQRLDLNLPVRPVRLTPRPSPPMSSPGSEDQERGGKRARLSASPLGGRNVYGIVVDDNSDMDVVSSDGEESSANGELGSPSPRSSMDNHFRQSTLLTSSILNTDDS